MKIRKNKLNFRENWKATAEGILRFKQPVKRASGMLINDILIEKKDM